MNSECVRSLRTAMWVLENCIERTDDLPQSEAASRQCRRNDAGDGNGIVVGKGGSGVEGIELMRCAQCQHDNPTGAKFCLECGTRFALSCTNCGTELPAGAKFCLECGQATRAQPTVDSHFASPIAYTPKAPRRKDSDFQECARRRAQAGHGVVR